MGNVKEQILLRKDIGEQNNSSKVEFEPDLQTIFENENIATLIETQKTFKPEK